MRIIVFDVAADSGGALSVLDSYYKKAKEDKRNEYFFVISTPILTPTSNIKVLRFPWVKRSWVHRVLFEVFVAHKLVSRYKADEVFSLQNLMILFTKVEQKIYLHQIIPYIDHKFSIFKDRKLWVYQNIISKIINFSLKRVSTIIVQADWIKEKIVKLAKIPEDRIIVDKPILKVVNGSLFKRFDKSQPITFFYPAAAYSYKNHEVILKAVQKIGKPLNQTYEVIFTISKYDNDISIRMSKLIESNNLPVKMIGAQSIDTVYSYYSKSVLLFPSLLETIGLPLLEAKAQNTPIIASDMLYAKNSLLDYDRVDYFDPNDDSYLVMLMKKYIERRK